MAGMALAMLATPAMAQMGKRHSGGDKQAQPAGSKVDEKAYKAALDRIPDSKQKYDPWGGVVASDPAKKPK